MGKAFLGIKFITESRIAPPKIKSRLCNRTEFGDTTSRSRARGYSKGGFFNVFAELLGEEDYEKGASRIRYT